MSLSRFFPSDEAGCPCIGKEPVDTNVRQWVFQHLGDQCGRNSPDVCPCGRRLRHVERVPKARRQYPRWQVMRLHEVDALPDEFHTIVADVIQPPNERAQERRTGKRSQQRLVRRED